MNLYRSDYLVKEGDVLIKIEEGVIPDDIKFVFLYENIGNNRL